MLDSIRLYRTVKRSIAAWGEAPSGLSYHDVALYLRLGQQLETEIRRGNGRREYWVLDLGTYFGHSAFTLLHGASLASPEPGMRLLSIDIFAQPAWLVNVPEVSKFVGTYGSTEPDGIGRYLEQVCASVRIPADRIRLLKQDVTILNREDLVQIAPDGFKLVGIDCAKTPELMNSIATILADHRVIPIGSMLVFQDLFDWHAPWNLYAFWRLLRAGNISMRYTGRAIPPVVQLTGHKSMGVICDGIHPGPIPETWCTPFTSPDNEMRALDDVRDLLDRLGCEELTLRVSCLKIGALLRAGCLNEAENLLLQLDRRWPATIKDGALQDAYRRMKHLQTGHKDLTLSIRTEHARRRAGVAPRMSRAVHARMQYLTKVECQVS